MKKEPFFISTPIYYVNGVPHIGHAYTSIITDTIARYERMNGKNVHFVTGVDENSQKAVLKADEQGKDIYEYLDEMSAKHREVWDIFHISYTDFIRTTEKRHHNLVQEVLQKCFDRGDIYDGMYEWLYCVGCEAFLKPEELIERDGKMVCPDHLTQPELVREKNYFFRLTRYQTWIEEFYEANPTFVLPDFRYNELKAFVKRGLEDFSISRETNTFWIPLPFDDTQVTYVWFDALFNYYTSCKYSKSGDKHATNFVDESKIFWENTHKKVHVVGKDIIRFHGIFWPCMLASYFELGEERDGVLHYTDSDQKYLPSHLLSGGFFTVDGQKMSKSIGNVIEPVEYIEKYGKDLLTLYMLSAFPIGNDGDYDREQAIFTYNAKLANNLGNLLNRLVVLSIKFGKKLENVPSVLEKKREDIQAWQQNFLAAYTQAMDEMDLKSALDETFSYASMLNKFADSEEPWNTIKDSQKDEITAEVLYVIADGLRQIGIALFPFFPEKMTELFRAIWLPEYLDELTKGNMNALQNMQEIFEIREKSPILFEKKDL